MSRSSGPVGDVAGRVTRNVTSRIVSKLAGLAVAALLAAVGLKQCGKPGSREQVAEHLQWVAAEIPPAEHYQLGLDGIDLEQAHPAT